MNKNVELKKTIRSTTPVPIISEETRRKFFGNFVAFSINSNLPEWDEKGAAKSRRLLADAMLPLVCGKHYYAHAIERLLGKCVRHKIGDNAFEVIESNSKIYYLDSCEVVQWKENAQVLFTPDSSHAFDLEVYQGE